MTNKDAALVIIGDTGIETQCWNMAISLSLSLTLLVITPFVEVFQLPKTVPQPSRISCPTVGRQNASRSSMVVMDV